MSLSIRSVLAILLMSTSAWSFADGHVKVYIISPANGEVVSSPVKVQFGLIGMGVAPAGVDRNNTGHHHLLIDVDKLPPMNQPIPADDNHRHFGGGQTEVILELSPGKHQLQLLLADHAHKPHKPVIVSAPVEIVVK
ncbi:MAG: DUF4399 domain-containing protein [Motiliproteus sp.]|nr:DUF4399 domain-containing protein [Motiliproteus sp.]MCW9052866.1 DUF4399 domain-containing protein [Motiliproteus sp.]